MQSSGESRRENAKVRLVARHREERRGKRWGMSPRVRRVEPAPNSLKASVGEKRERVNLAAPRGSLFLFGGSCPMHA